MEKKYYWYLFQWRREHMPDYAIAFGVTDQMPVFEVLNHNKKYPNEEHVLLNWKEITEAEFNALDGEI